MSEFGVDCFLRTRVREGKPSVHYQLEIVRRENLRWFVRNIGKRSRLHRKNRYLREELLQRFRQKAQGSNLRSAKREKKTAALAAPHLLRIFESEKNRPPSKECTRSSGLGRI
jgi:hypothetical protein